MVIENDNYLGRSAELRNGSEHTPNRLSDGDMTLLLNATNHSGHGGILHEPTESKLSKILAVDIPNKFGRNENAAAGVLSSLASSEVEKTRLITKIAGLQAELAKLHSTSAAASASASYNMSPEELRNLLALVDNAYKEEKAKHEIVDSGSSVLWGFVVGAAGVAITSVTTVATGVTSGLAAAGNSALALLGIGGKMAVANESNANFGNLSGAVNGLPLVANNNGKTAATNKNAATNSVV